MSSFQAGLKLPGSIGSTCSCLLLCCSNAAWIMAITSILGVITCELALSKPKYRVVATGKVHNTTSVVAHGRPLPSGFMRVAVDYAIEKQTPLPMPNEDADVFVIEEAIGTLVLWPTELIIVNSLQDENKNVLHPSNNEVGDSHSHTPSKKNKEKNPKILNIAKAGDSSHASSKIQPRKLDMSDKTIVPHPETLPPDLQMLHKYALKMTHDEQINIPIDIGISGQDRQVFIGKEEIFQLLAQEELGVCHILSYMSMWYRRCQMLGLVNMFGFLCPSRISPISQFKKGEIKKATDHRMERTRYIVDTFIKGATKGRVFIAPYNAGRHWVLCVIDPFNDIVYFMDPLHNEIHKGTGNGVSDDLRAMCERAILLFHTEREVQKKLKINTKWSQIQVPRQQNGIDCGYFVMRYMKEIIEHKQTHINEDYYFDCSVPCYDQEKIDEVRVELARYIFLLI